MQFMHLMALAQRRVVLQGNDINQEGRPHEEMFLIVEGSADVSAGRQKRRARHASIVPQLVSNPLRWKFVIAAAARRVISASKIHFRHRSHDSSLVGSPARPRLTPTNFKDLPTKTLPPHYHRSRSCIFAPRQVRSEGEAVCRLEAGGFVGSMAFNRLIQESPLSSHAAAVPAPEVEDDDKHRPDSVFLDSFVVGDGEYKYGGKGVFEVTKEAFYNVLRGDSVVGKVAMSLVPDVVEGRKDLEKMERSRNTVTATSDVRNY